MSESVFHSVSVAGVTLDDSGRVLLIRRRDNGEWQAPGGVLELGETFEEGVQREVYEETGVHVEVGPLTGAYKNMVKGVVALVYRCTALSGMPTKSDESVDVEWLDKEEALRIMSPAFSVRVQDACSFDYRAASRAHDGVAVIYPSID